MNTIRNEYIEDTKEKIKSTKRILRKCKNDLEVKEVAEKRIAYLKQELKELMP